MASPKDSAYTKFVSWHKVDIKKTTKEPPCLRENISSTTGMYVISPLVLNTSNTNAFNKFKM